MNIDIEQLVEDTLLSAYIAVRGKSPKEGSFRPNEDTMAAIKGCFNLSKGESELKALAEYCRDSMWAHLSRTEGTKTPYYVNTVLFSESAIDYTNKHRDYLRRTFASGQEPLRFKQDITAAVAPAEKDWLDVYGRYAINAKVKGEQLVLPDGWMDALSVWWMMASVELGRFTEIPEEWLRLKSNCDGHTALNADHVAEFKASLHKDKGRYQVFMETAEQSIYEVGITFCTRWQGLIRPLYRAGKVYAAGDSKTDVAFLRDPNITLAERDDLLFDAVAKHVQRPVVSDQTISTEKPTPAMLRRLAMSSDE